MAGIEPCYIPDALPTQTPTWNLTLKHSWPLLNWFATLIIMTNLMKYKEHLFEINITTIWALNEVLMYLE